MNALFDIQQNLKCIKGQYNAFGGYSYRSCEDILEAVKPLLKETKSVLTLTDDLVLIGDRYYIKATAKITFADGNSVEVSAFAREEETKRGFDGSQLTGSTSSYARKYALNGLFAIDDVKESDNTNHQSNDEKADENLLSPNQKKIIDGYPTVTKKWIADNYGEIDKLTREQATSIITAVTKKQEGKS